VCSCVLSTYYLHIIYITLEGGKVLLPVMDRQESLMHGRKRVQELSSHPTRKELDHITDHDTKNSTTRSLEHINTYTNRRFNRDMTYTSSASLSSSLSRATHTRTNTNTTHTRRTAYTQKTTRCASSCLASSRLAALRRMALRWENSIHTEWGRARDGGPLALRGAGDEVE
jgi:hypothetical protein